MLIILGNYMPKTKKNHITGIRVSWSMYNDITWMKSNRFGGAARMLAGLSTIITAFFARSAIVIVLLLVYILATTAITFLYSYKVYKAEHSKNN